MKKNKSFSCKKSQTQIQRALARYLGDSDEVDKEKNAFAAGIKISGGDYDVANLLLIADWKSPRRKALIESNPEPVVTEIIGLACSATHECTAIAVLCGLSGVGVPMASAILTAIYRDRYTVIDRRVLMVLTGNKWEPTVADYVRYLDFCKTTATKYGMSLRDLDRALWTMGA